MNLDTYYYLHAGGVTEIVSVRRGDLDAVIAVLTHCESHGASHVFVVDQSTSLLDDPAGFVRIGVSRHGADCLRKNL